MPRQDTVELPPERRSGLVFGGRSGSKPTTLFENDVFCYDYEVYVSYSVVSDGL